MFISKLFKFTVHSWRYKGKEEATKFQNFSSLQFIKNPTLYLLTYSSISKLFKFTVHVLENWRVSSNSPFQNFSSLQFIAIFSSFINL